MTDEARQEHDHLPDEVERGEEPPAEGGLTAPDPARSPSERTSPPGNPGVDEERLEHDREDYERSATG
jgi:hypothetical protein